ncbi:MAG: thrombospondin type 3 repeat-containing protein [Gammaproteobacteria bacterium]
MVGSVVSSGVHAYSATATVNFIWGGAAPAGNSKAWTSSGANTLTTLSDATYFTTLTGNNSNSYFDADFAIASDYDGATKADDCLTPEDDGIAPPDPPGTDYDTIQLRRYGCRVSDVANGYNSPLFKLTPVLGTGPAASASGQVVITDTTITGILTVNATTDEAGGSTGYNYRSSDGSPFGNVWYGVSNTATLTVNLTGTFTATNWQITGGTARLEDPSFQCQQGGFGGVSPGFILCNPSTVAGGFQSNGAALSWGWDWDGAGTGIVMGEIPVYDSSGTTLLDTISGVLAALTLNAGGNIATVTGEYRSGLGSSGNGCPTSIRWTGATINCGTLTAGPLLITGTAVTQSGPTVTLAANPTMIASGAASTLTWSSTNATSCTASGGWTGAKSTSGSQSTGNLVSTTTYTLTCTGPGGSVSQSVPVTVASPPSVTLSASPTTVASGAASTLTWSSTNVTSCTASGGWSGSRSTSGSQSTGNLTGTTTYTLTCTGAGGSVTQSTTVTVGLSPPSVTLSASPTTVASGAASTLTWSSTNATSCTASGGWSGAKSTSGSQSTGNLTATTTYTLTCTGVGGSASQSVTVVVDGGTGGQRTASITFTWGGAAPDGNAKGWTSSGANTLNTLTNGTYFTAVPGNNSTSYFDADFAIASDYDGATKADDCLTPEDDGIAPPDPPGTDYDTIQLRRYGCRVSDVANGYNSPLFKLTPVLGTGPAASASGQVVITDTTITGILTVNATTDEAGGSTGYNYRSSDGSPFGNVWYGVSNTATLTVNLTGTFTATNWQITGGTARLEDPSFQCQQGGFGGVSPGFILCNPSTVAGGFQSNGAGLSWGWDVDGAGLGTTMSGVPVYDTTGTTLLATLGGVLASLTLDGSGNITTVTGEYRSGLGNTGGGCPTSIRWTGSAINCGTLTVGPLVITGIATPAPLDTSPDGFSFSDQSDVGLDVAVTSAPIAVTGINVSVPISVTGAPSSQYSINGGPFTGAAGTVGNGQMVRVRHTSSIIPDTTESTVLNVGGVTDTFTSTTLKYAFDDVASTTINTPVVIPALLNDLGFPEPVYAGIWVDPLHGTATVTGSPGPQSGISITYTPSPGYSGPDSFQYWAEGGSVVDYGFVSISVINNDSDGDGVLNAVDNCPLAANPGQQDGDGDGVGNACDNCVERSNANQRDTNVDGYGNICDADLNNSGMVTAADYAIFRARINTNNADADFNGSGVVTALDYAILRSYLNLPPGPSGLSCAGTIPCPLP